MAKRCEREWIYSSERLDGKFIYSCLCLGFAILKTAAPQRRRRGAGRCKVLIEELMIFEGFNERFCLSQPSLFQYANCPAGPVPALSWTTCSGENEWPHCVLPTLTAGRRLRLILELLPRFVRAELLQKDSDCSDPLIVMQYQWRCLSWYFTPV